MRKDTLTTFEIADFCQVTHRTVQQWIASGKLTSFRTPGNHSRVQTKDFIVFLKKFNMPIPETLEHLTRLKKRVMIVDDDQDLVQVISKMINPSGQYDVEVAFDGFAAGKKFAEFKPDLITLDIRMPRLDGYAVCKEVRRDSKNNNVKILIVSGEDALNKEELEKMGADAFLSKPFTKETLVKEVQRLLC